MPASRPAVVDLTAAQARRIALRAQGLDRGGTARAVARPTARHLQAVVDRLGLLQIDSVNVLARAHLMPTFSRIGPYDTALLDRATSQPPRRLVETWAHEASFVPPETYRLLGWRRRAYLHHAWGMIRDVPLQHSAVVDEVRDLVTARGPLTSRDVHAVLAQEHPRSAGGEWGWNWSVAKRALEFLFFTGEIGSAGRTASFERRYDLTERIVPPEVLALPEPSDAEAVRALVALGARAHGVGTSRCFADYFRVRGPRVARAVDELVEDGVLVPVTVQGWERPVFLHRDAAQAPIPRSARGRALLSPFDPLVFERRRLEELFGMRYRIEIYTPAAKRTHGYYVLPFLLGDRLVARTDLKADRRTGTLLVRTAWLEPSPVRGGPGDQGGPVPPAAHVARELAAELDLLASWLGLTSVRAADDARGDLLAELVPALDAPQAAEG